jgi:hypothetical protein
MSSIAIAALISEGVSINAQSSGENAPAVAAKTQFDQAQTLAGGRTFGALQGYGQGNAGVFGWAAPALRGANVLVVKSTGTNAEDYLEEDLRVMAHVLDNTVAGQSGSSGGSGNAMGISVFFPTDGTSATAVYLEGYGALFTLRVNFPLMTVKKGSEEGKQKETGDSAWEEARRQLYGQPESELNAGENHGETYSQEKVDRLKKKLIEALRNARNIRGLKPEDYVTVCVLGSANPAVIGTRRVVMGQRGGAATYTVADPFYYNALMGGEGWQVGSVMTMRAKKADVDALAARSIGEGDFEGRVLISIYAGGPSEINRVQSESRGARAN